MNIALVADDSKKKLMQNLCIAYRSILTKHTLYATQTTGLLIEQVTNLTVKKFISGGLGGMEQVASQIEHNNIDVVIFLRDSTYNIKYEYPTQISQLCDLYNIPLATNLATAELVIRAIERGIMDWKIRRK